MNEVWIVNSSPVIVLAKVGRLRFLTDLASELLLPQAVVAELLAAPSADPAREAVENG